MKLHAASQVSRGASPWTRWERLGLLLWEYAWVVFCIWTPKPLNFWRLLVLRIFGAEIHGRPFVHQRARIQIPWNVRLEDRACVGDRANLYSLDLIVLGEAATVAQEAYLCTGTHDFTNDASALMTAPIVIGARSFVGARAFILPGVTVGSMAIVGACSVVTRDVPDGATVRGNPARCSGASGDGNSI